MIRTMKMLFCDNDHGTGDETFPLVNDLEHQDFIQARTIRQLRIDAKKAGWSRHNGADYCESCTGGSI